MKPPREDKWRVTLRDDPSRLCPEHHLPLTWYQSILPGGEWVSGRNRRDNVPSITYGDELGFCPEGHLVKEFLSPEGEIWKVDEEE